MERAKAGGTGKHFVSKAALAEGLPGQEQAISASSLGCKATPRAPGTCRKSTQRMVHTWGQQVPAPCSLPELTSIRAPPVSVRAACGAALLYQNSHRGAVTVAVSGPSQQQGCYSCPWAGF